MKTLLLTNYFEPLAFITLKRLAKFLANDKVEIINVWDENIIELVSGSIQYPATVRLTYSIDKKWRTRTKFTRRAVFRRDFFCCCYCGKAETPRKLTLDHVIPKSKGGNSNWMNIVTACSPCNNQKADRTPEEAGIKLIKKPSVPSHQELINEYMLMKNRHDEWEIYFKDEVERVKPHFHIKF